MTFEQTFSGQCPGTLKGLVPVDTKGKENC